MEREVEEIDREIERTEQVITSLRKIIEMVELLGAVNNNKAVDVEIHNRLKGLIDN